MILSGFEIENWSCIKKVSVADLPRNGVILLHGPNRRGKSSIVKALRACLMDYASSTTALKLWYPRGTGEKPVVTATFHAGGKTYRIRKCFGSKESELASKTSTGDWKVETTSAAEAHERTCGYAGGNDSTKGLHQLLWLAQAEFRLPDAKKFDATVQSQLRSILGVLQTPLDDQFIERVKKRWNEWFSGQRKADKTPTIKDKCRLAEKLKKLDADRKELQESDAKFNEAEGCVRQIEDLGIRQRDLERQLTARTGELQTIQEEHRQCQSRIEGRQRAVKDHAHAVKENEAAEQEKLQRDAAAQRCIDSDKAIEPAREKVTEFERQIGMLVKSQDGLRALIGSQRAQQNALRRRTNRVAVEIQKQVLAEQLSVAQQNADKADSVAADVLRIEKYLADHAAPDKSELEELNANRRRAVELRANLDAASMNLKLTPKQGAFVARLAIDGSSKRVVAADSATAHTIRRKAELQIDGWGLVELSRGVGSDDLADMEDKLRNCETEFANAIAPFGVSAADAQAMQLLMDRAAEHRSQTAEFAEKKKELKKIAPQGPDGLHCKVVELNTKYVNALANTQSDGESLPADRAELDKLVEALAKQINTIDLDIVKLENESRTAETELTTAQREETAAKESLAVCKTTANNSRDELNRLRTAEQIAQRIADAATVVTEAATKLLQSELTDAERTIDVRLETAEEAVRALERQIAENSASYNRIKGRLEGSEGLHAQNAMLAARVDELTRFVGRDTVERDAVDRLYALFEECREKQLGTLMGPIHDRVLNWMHILDLGDYKKIGFNDAFLPEKLLSRDETAEFAIDEESTGAQEQIAMLVRLALGSILTSADEPQIAIFDDPLTHCDVGRLSKMRAILHRAAAGDPMATPSIGPLQIIIFTCHPEWFDDGRATVINLEDPNFMSRSAG